jgi:hypothetical protein
VDDPYVLKTDSAYHSFKVLLEALARMWSAWPTKVHLRVREDGTPDLVARAEDFSGRNYFLEPHKLVYLSFDGVLLPIGAHLPLAETPQVIARVEVWTALATAKAAAAQCLGT